MTTALLVLGLIGSQVIVYVVGLAAALEWKGRRPVPPADRFDAVVVLGCRVRADGTPTPTLVRRVEHGARLVLGGRAPRLVIAGGKVQSQISEASAALSSALAVGLPRDAITLEERSQTTDENASEVAALLGDRTLSLLIVTDAYHVPRSVRLFRKHFDRVAGDGVRGSGVARVKNALREAFVLVAYLARGRLD